MSLTHSLSARPFVIQHDRIAEPAGHFVPAARLVLTPALRTSGLLAALSDEHARTLLAVLTFLTANGEVQATAGEVADALAVSQAQARRRLDGLTDLQPGGQPLLVRRLRDAGLPVYTLAREQVDTAQLPEPDPEPSQQLRPADPDAVRTFSRATYGTPRADAERVVAEQLGHAIEESADTPEGEARRRLHALGVDRQDVEELLAGYAVEDVLRQLDWLPERGPRNPARLIVAAIRGNYEAPLSWRPELADAIDTVEAKDSPAAEDNSGSSDVVSLEVPCVVEGGSDGA